MKNLILEKVQFLFWYIGWFTLIFLTPIIPFFINGVYSVYSALTGILLIIVAWYLSDKTGISL